MHALAQPIQRPGHRPTITSRLDPASWFSSPRRNVSRTSIENPAPCLVLFCEEPLRQTGTLYHPPSASFSSQLRPRVLSNPPFLPLPYRHAISFHSDVNAQSSARPAHLRERLDAVVPTTEQYLVHHTLLRRLLGTAPYLHIALEVVSQVFRFRRHQLLKMATFVMRGSLRKATLQRDAMPCRFL